MRCNEIIARFNEIKMIEFNVSQAYVRIFNFSQFTFTEFYAFKVYT